jgi:hypothetical protein
MNGTVLEHTFAHPIGAQVRISCSDEAGIVIARAEFDTAEDSYLIRYRAADGRAVEAWWTSSALQPI